MTIAGAFDQSGYVGDNKGTKVAMTDHTKIWYQSGERVVGNLWTSGGDTGD